MNESPFLLPKYFWPHIFFYADLFYRADKAPFGVHIFNGSKISSSQIELNVRI